VMEKEEEQLEKIVGVCRTHALRLNEAHESLLPILPLTEQSYVALTREQRAFLDQYIFRFVKLQDAMGDKLFKSILLRVGDILLPVFFNPLLSETQITSMNVVL